MPALQIPDDHKIGLKRLLALSEEQSNQLLLVLGSLPFDASPKDCGSLVAQQMKDLGSDAEKLFRTIESLYQARAYLDRSPDRFISELSEAIRSDESIEIGTSPEDLMHVRSRLAALLGVVTLSLRSKAFVLGREHEHILHETRLLTDLRPVFDDVAAAPKGFVVTQTLKIVYHDGKRHNEIYLALDAKDLADLASSVKRAQEKSDTLLDWLQKVDARAFWG